MMAIFKVIFQNDNAVEVNSTEDHDLGCENSEDEDD